MNNKIEIPVQTISEIKEFVENYINQDNRGTAWPYSYVVQQKKEKVCAEGYNNSYKMYYDNETEASLTDDNIEEYLQENEMEIVRDDWGDLVIPDSINEVWCVKEFEDVQWFFTEVEANKYLSRDRHNLTSPRLYVDYFRRNTEAEFILRTMFSIAGYDYDKESRK